MVTDGVYFLFTEIPCKIEVKDSGKKHIMQKFCTMQFLWRIDTGVENISICEFFGQVKKPYWSEDCIRINCIMQGLSVHMYLQYKGK